MASAFGLEYGRRKAEYACMKHFISLDHSPIKSTLVDMYVPFKLSVLSSVFVFIYFFVLNFMLEQDLASQNSP